MLTPSQRHTAEKEIKKILKKERKNRFKSLNLAEGKNLTVLYFFAKNSCLITNISLFPILLQPRMPECRYRYMQGERQNA